MTSFLHSVVGALGAGYPARIPIRVPNDDSAFNPKEFPNIVFRARGRLSGKVTLVHGSPETDESGLGLISTRIWVSAERDKDHVHIYTSFDHKTHTFTLQGPEGFNLSSIYHETRIHYPRTVSSVDSLTVEAPITTLNGGEDLGSLFFGSIQSSLSNAAISLDSLQADVVRLHTSNSSISGTFQAGHLELASSNGAISSKVSVRNARDGQQSRVSITTSNASLDLHVTASEDSTRGLWLDAQTRNGRASAGILIAKADRASFINFITSNAKIDFNADARSSGQDLEVHTKTTNGPVVSSIMVPPRRLFKGEVTSSNALANLNLTDEYEGNFELNTSNSTSVVEGSNITLEEDKKVAKRGYRVQKGPSSVTVHSSNSPISLRFFPAGLSL